MEIYKITCKVNNKVYIGSTKLTKEKRWGDLSSNSSHLSCVRNGKHTPLYDDIKKYGKEMFELETIEKINCTRHELYKKEDYWIKKYWDILGENMIYNQFRGSHGNKNWKVPFSLENQRKAAKARKEKYGSPNFMTLTPEAIKKAKQTKIKKYGKVGVIVTKEGKKSHDIKVSNQILDTFDNQILIGYNAVKEKLNNEGYLLTYWVSRRLVNGIISKENILKYPKLNAMRNRFKILNKKTRKK